jgi:hypothetical protein
MYVSLTNLFLSVKAKCWQNRNPVISVYKYAAFVNKCCFDRGFGERFVTLVLDAAVGEGGSGEDGSGEDGAAEFGADQVCTAEVGSS